VRIEKIILKNYRQFRDVEILLNKSLSSDLNIFIGKNGAGKTNILNAINWCLYGDEPHLSKDSQQLPMLNLQTIKETIDEGDQEVMVEVYVKLEEERTIIFTRRATYRVYKEERLPQLRNCDFEARFSDEKGNTKFLQNEDAVSLVERFVSKDMREFFFFDGERLDNYFKIATIQNISHAVFVISQIDLLRNKIENRLDTVLRELRREAGKENPKIDEIRNRLEEDEDKLKDVENRIEECKKQIEIAKGKAKECSDNLMRIPDVEALEKERERLKREKKSKKEILDTKKKERQDLLFEYEKIIFLWPAIENSLQTINEKKRLKEIPPTVDRSLLEEILKNKVCSICGTPLNDTSEKRVNDLLQNIKLSSIISQKLLNMENPLRSFIEESKFFDEKLRKINYEITDYNKNLERIEIDLSEIDKKLSGYDPERIRRWQEQRKEYEEIQTKNQKLLGQLEMKRDELNKSIDDLKKQYEDELKKEKKFELIKKQIDFCSKALDVAKKTEEIILRQTREKIESETNKLFFNLIWKKETFKNVEIKPDFNINLIHSMGYECLGTISSAEREVLALSFTLALQTISGFNSPILIDTPVARVSDELRTNFGKVLLDVSTGQQIILLFTPSEYDKDISKLLDPRSSGRFMLKLSSNEKEVKMEVL